MEEVVHLLLCRIYPSISGILGENGEVKGHT